jgi:hypothetical protein
LAGAVDYTFTYDPVSGLTTMSNSLTSSSAFDFYTLVGPYRGKDFQLPPGATVTVDQFGNVTGSYSDPLVQICKNKKNSNTPITITNPDKSTIFIVFADGTKFQTKASSITVPASQLAGGEIYSSNDFTVSSDAVITTLEPTAMMFDSPAFAFPGKVNYEVLYGSMEIADNTQTWTTMFDQNVMAGCVPEPPTAILLLSVVPLFFLAYAWRMRRSNA